MKPMILRFCIVLLYSRHHVLADDSASIMEETLEVPFPLHQLIPPIPPVEANMEYGGSSAAIRVRPDQAYPYAPYDPYETPPPYVTEDDNYLSPVAFYIIVGLTLLLTIINSILLSLLVFCCPEEQHCNREVRVCCVDEGCNLMPMPRREYCHQSPRNYTVECNCAVTTERVHDECSDTSASSSTVYVNSDK